MKDFDLVRLIGSFVCLAAAVLAVGVVARSPRPLAPPLSCSAIPLSSTSRESPASVARYGTEAERVDANMRCGCCRRSWRVRASRPCEPGEEHELKSMDAARLQHAEILKKFALIENECKRLCSLV
jgi:hypothetical protein